MRIRAVLLDVDGTLVDSTVVHALCWHEALRVYGHNVPSTQLHRAIGMGSERILDHVLGDGDGDGDGDRDRSHDDAITEAHKVLYRQHWERLAVLPGAVQLLQTCKKLDWTVVLASSAKSDDLAMLRRVLDADEYIDATTDASDVADTKPAAEPVQVALQRAGVGPAEALFVGDSVWDAAAAAKAGVAFAGVSGGAASEQELRAAGAIDTAETPGRLAAVFEDSGKYS